MEMESERRIRSVINSFLTFDDSNRLTWADTHRVAGFPAGVILNCCITAGLLPVREWFGAITWPCCNISKFTLINVDMD